MTNARLADRFIPWKVQLVAMLVVIFFLASGHDSSSAEVGDKPIQVKVNDKVIALEKDPIKIKGTTLVPFRPLFEELGMKVEWDSVNRVVTGSKDDLKIVLRIGSTSATVNGKTVKLLQAPQVQNGFTLVPLRFVSEATDALVAWNPYMPQVLVYTNSYLEANGVTREEAQKQIDKELARIKKEYEAQQAANKPPTPVAVPKAPEGSGIYKPAVSDKVDLSKLQGMYYGFRDDNGGYECGGMCWDIYTFLPGDKVVLGAPTNGGPETIDCASDKCYDYSITNGKMKLNNGDVYEIAVKDGEFLINDVELQRVKPVTNNMRLSESYIYRGYLGLIGISSGATSWSESIVFYKNGTFKSSKLMVGNVQGGAPTTGASGSELSGSYRITGNTLVMASANGDVGNYLFFIHEESKSGPYDKIQIGEKYFYVDED